MIEAVTACPVSYGRRNKMGGGYDMLMWQKEHAVSVEKAKGLTPEEMRGKFIIGEIYKTEAPEYTEVYDQLIEKARGKNKGE